MGEEGSEQPSNEGGSLGSETDVEGEENTEYSHLSSENINIGSPFEGSWDKTAQLYSEGDTEKSPHVKSIQTEDYVETSEDGGVEHLATNNENIKIRVGDQRCS